MSTYEELLSMLLEQKPDLTREEAERRIREKKDRIGAGYLTDQGAVFLIASDLGVTLAEPAAAEIGLKDLHSGAKEVSLQARMLNMSPLKQYSRKDGSQFNLRTMTVYDADSTASVKLWDEKASLPGIGDLKPGDLVKITKAYVKSDLNGASVINIGSGSTIGRAGPEGSASQDSPIPSIDSITKDVGGVGENDTNAAVSGILDGAISTMRYTNSRGQASVALKMSLKGGDGRSTRVVIWGKDETAVPRIIPMDTKVVLYGVRAKQGMQQEMELHGNEATVVSVEGQKEAEPVVVRIVSGVKGESGDCMIIGVDKNRNFINITDSSGKAAGLADGEIMECMPSKAHGSSVWLGEDSFVRRLDEDPGMPPAGSVRTKIAEVSMGRDICIESVILKKTERRDVQTKSGDTVGLSSMLVEDDSGQIWVNGWRNQARAVDKCETGEVVAITGLNARAGLEGRMELTLGGFSKIMPVSTGPKSP